MNIFSQAYLNEMSNILNASYINICVALRNDYVKH